MYGELVYRIGKRYRKARQENPSVEFPSFSGELSDLVSDDVLAELPDLQGEYVISYRTADGTDHLIRVYFECGQFQAQGTDDELDGGYSLSGHVA